MYIVTGLGRSGTSFVAQILKECGIFVGDYFNPAVNAGYEHPDAVRINKKIVNGDFWGNAGEIAEMRRLAARIQAAKDPRFALTLGHWIRSQAQIDGVFLCLRDLHEVFASSERSNAGTMSIFNGLPKEHKLAVANSILEGLQKLCRDCGIAVYPIRYPESVDDFNEVACLAKIVPDMVLLRSAWERSRQPRAAAVATASHTPAPSDSESAAERQQASASAHTRLSIDEFRSFEDYTTSLNNGLGKVETARRAIEDAFAARGDAFTVHGFCWTCGAESEFLVDRQSVKTQAPRTVNWRERLTCSRCGMNSRKRATLHLFHELLAPQPDAKIYIPEQLSPLYRWLSRNYAHTIGSEYLGSRAPLGAQGEQGARNEDLTQLTFPDASFDYMLTLDVFEHIPDVRSALRECRRVLKSSGALFFTVPFDRGSEKNVVRAVLDERGGVTHLLPPDYHGNPLDPKGSLSFHTFGWELLDQVREAGFADVRACLYWSREFAYLGGNLMVFVAFPEMRAATTQRIPHIENAAAPAVRSAEVPIVESPVFVVGCPRSGTTALARALGEHSQLWVSTESDFIQHLMGSVSAAYSFGTKRKGIWLSTEHVGKEEFYAHIGYGINALFTSRSEGRRWIDHSNSTTYNLEEFATMFPRAKFLHIVRDGRDTVNSMIHFKPTQPWAADFATACGNWKHFVSLGLTFEERHPDRVLRISYEKLVENSRREFGRVLTFLGLPFEQSVIDFYTAKRINSSFTDQERQKMNWQNAWQGEDHATFRKLCSDLMTSLGYYGEEVSLHTRAVERANAGDLAAAIGLLEQCVELSPEKGVLHNDLGVLYTRMKDAVKAEQHYHIAVAIEPQNTTYLRNFAEFFFMLQGKAPEALDLYQRIIALDPEDKEALFGAANLFIAQKRYSEAREYLERYLRLDPFNLDAKLALGALLENEGRNQQADAKPITCSIVIPVFNKAEYTKKCIAALRQNTTPDLYEVIVVDNASTDETGEYLASLAGDNFTVITNAENVGFTRACNQGARIARGEYILFLNNDTEPKPGWLEALLDVMKSDPQAGIAGSKLIYPDGRLQEAGGIVFNDGSGWNYGRFDDPAKPEYNFVREADYVSGASLLVRNSLLASLGYFDEQYSPGYYEDTDLCFAARAAGYKVLYTPFSEVVHYEGISSGNDLTQGMKQYQRVNRDKFVAKWAEALKAQHRRDRSEVVSASERGTKGNVLVIDPFLPMYDRASGSLRLFTIVSLLRKQGYHVTFIARNGQGQEAYAAVLKKIGVEVYATDPDMLRHMGYAVDARQIDLRAILTSRFYECAWLSFYSIALQYLFAVRAMSPATRVLIDTVDIHFIREMRRAELARDADALERAKVTRKHELFIYSKADAIATVTEQDWDHIRAELPGKPHFVIPNIHDIPVATAGPEGREGLLFVGNFNHPPNVDAVLWFSREIFPHVRKAAPGTTFTIVGNNPPKEVLALQAEDVIVTGYVPSTAPYLEKARVSVAPLRYGAGMKGKIGEAMACGLPVVTTTVGAEGMGLIHNETAFIADKPEEIARWIARLLSDDRLWQAMSHKGREFMSERFSPEEAAGSLTRMMDELAKLKPLAATAGPLLVPSGDVRKGAVSIIMLTWNELKYTKECVESIRRHTPEPHELVFVDNGSTDGTVKWLRRLVKELPNCRLIENTKNLGFAKGCNQGIEASSGEYIVLLNNDTVVTKDWLFGLLSCLESAPGAGIVGPMTNSISGIQKVPAVGYSSLGELDEYSARFRESNRNRRVEARRVVGFCMLFRQELAIRIGLLDESFGAGNFEDDDFCLRASLAGFRNYIAGDVFIHHYGSRSFIGNRIDYGSALGTNRKVFDEKWSSVDARTVEGKRLASLNARERADAAYFRDDIPAAVAALIDGIKLAPDENDIYRHLAEILIDAKSYRDALEAINSLPAEARNDARSLELSAYCKEGLDLLDEAGACADGALALDPRSAPALNLKGMVAYKKGDKSAADAFFRKALAANPSYGEASTNLGILLWAGGEKGEGFRLLEQGFLLSPAISDCAATYHTAAIASGKLARAEQTFREAQGLVPRHKRITFLLTDLLINQGKHQEAMQEIEESIAAFGLDQGLLAAALAVREKIGPKEIGTSHSVGTLSLCMIVKNEEAHIARCLRSVQPLVDEMIVVDTGSTDRTKDIAKVFGARVFDFAWTEDFSAARNFSLDRAAGDWVLVLDADEVISALDLRKLLEITKRKLQRPEAYTLTTRNYSNDTHMQGWIANDGVYPREEAGTGWYPSAKARLFTSDSRFRFENPVHEFVDNTIRRAGVSIKSCPVPVHHYGRFDRARTLAKGEAYYLLGRKKLGERADDPKAIYELAVQAGELGRYEEAEELWHKLLALRPDDAPALFNLGFVQLKQGNFHEALDASRRALELDPGIKEAVLNYANAELYIGDEARAVAALEKTLAQFPDYPPVMGLLAAACYVEGKKERGLELFAALGKKGFDCIDFLQELAETLVSTGRVRQAMAVIEAAAGSNNLHRNSRALLEKCGALIAAPETGVPADVGQACV